MGPTAAARFVMVFLVVEPHSAAEALAAAKKLGCAIWLGSDALALIEEEFNRWGI